MRKFMATVGTILAVTMVAGCGGSAGAPKAGSANPAPTAAQPAAKQDVQVMVWGAASNVEDDAKALAAAFPDTAAKYNLQAVVGGQRPEDVAQKFRLALSAGGDVPDIIKFNLINVPEFAEAGVLTDLTTQITPYLNNLVPGARNLITYKGHLVAFPYELKPKVWFYRKDMFDAAGIDPTQVHNLNDLIAAGKKLQAKFPKSYIWNLGKTIDSYDLGMLISGNGARVIDDKGNYIIASDAGYRSAFQALKQLKDSGVTVEINNYTPDWEHAFADGTLASTLISPWFKTFLPNYAKDGAGKWAVTQWPEIAGATGGSEAGGSVYVIPAKAKHKDAAIEILTKLRLTKEGNLAVLKAHHVTPITADSINDPAAQQPDPYFGPSLHEAEAKAAQTLTVFPYTPAATLELTIVNQFLSKYLNGELPLDDALNQAQAALKNQIGNPLQH